MGKRSDEETKVSEFISECLVERECRVRGLCGLLHNPPSHTQFFWKIIY